VVDGETGLLVGPADLTALAEALGRLADDPGLRHRMGMAGRVRAAERFGLDAMAARYAACYEEVASAGVVTGTPRPIR